MQTNEIKALFLPWNYSVIIPLFLFAHTFAIFILKILYSSQCDFKENVIKSEKPNLVNFEYGISTVKRMKTLPPLLKFVSSRRKSLAELLYIQRGK